MPRVKGGLLHAKRRRGILKHTKGFRWGRKSKIKVAKVAKFKAGQHAYASRRTKKRLNRGLWNVRINAAARKLGISYSKLMDALKKKEISLDRKVLSEIAAKNPTVFEKIVEAVK
ncbi:MAG TPA: 50S ribosomal protein L20 [Patescibacteria group bacterium]|nr:50S ribosomal protein L20 [Patescibacteria group bacterium]